MPYEPSAFSILCVALRKESVDRNNNQIAVGYGNCLVALRKESVDRNSLLSLLPVLGWWSLSARRAWIEIPALLGNNQNAGVALRKESVDRNRLI